MKDFKKGDLIKVGESLGVVIGLEGETDVQEDHLLIWYGQTEKSAGGELHKARTVPKEYCKLTQPPIIYH